MDKLLVWYRENVRHGLSLRAAFYFHTAINMPAKKTAKVLKMAHSAVVPNSFGTLRYVPKIL